MTDNIGQIYLTHALNNADRAALLSKNSEVTYGHLHDLIVSFAVRLKAQGVDNSSLVAINTNFPTLAVASFVAIGLLGARWIHATREVMNNSLIPITHYLHDDTVNHGVGPNIIRMDATWSRLPGSVSVDEPLMFSGHDDPDDTWMYIQSSGTTGVPKIAPVSYRLIAKRVERMARDHRNVGRTIAATAPPLSTPGVQSMLGMAALGATMVRTRDPNDWQAKNVEVVVGTPAQHRDVLEHWTEGMPRVRMLSVGGAKASSRFIAESRKIAEIVQIGYGSSEAGSICRKVVGPEDVFDNLGPAHPECTLEIVSPDDEPLPANEVGIVRIKSPTMVTGYVFQREQTNSEFRNGWFYPGDLGVLDAEGNFRVTGRVNDMLNIGGVKVIAPDIDDALEHIPGVIEAMAFAQDTNGSGVDSLVVQVTEANPARDRKIMAKEIRETCKTKFGKGMVPSRIYFVGDIPKGPRGKPLRREGIANSKDADFV